MFKDVDDMNSARDALVGWMNSQEFEGYDTATVCFALIGLLVYENVEDPIYQLFIQRNLAIIDQSLQFMKLINRLPKE